MKVTIPRLRGGLTPLIAVIVMLALFPIIGVPPVWLLYLFLLFIYLAMANMWNLLAGYSGLICLCPAAFVGRVHPDNNDMAWFALLCRNNTWRYSGGTICYAHIYSYL